MKISLMFVAIVDNYSQLSYVNFWMLCASRVCFQYIEAETKGPTFPRPHFQIPYLEWKCLNYTNPGYGLSLVDSLWNAGSYQQPLEQEGNPMT